VTARLYIWRCHRSTPESPKRPESSNRVAFQVSADALKHRLQRLEAGAAPGGVDGAHPIPGAKPEVLGHGWGMSTEGLTLLLRLKVLLRDVHPAVWRRVRLTDGL
jgi:hypothetical protein